MVTPQPADKPKCKLIGEDGNIFSLIGLARRALKESDLPDKREKMDELYKRATSTSSYGEALSIIMEYVEVY